MRANERGAYVGDICVSGVRLSKSQTYMSVGTLQH